MTYPPNLLRLDPAFRVLLPEGATGATGELDYQGPYRVASVLAGGTSDVKVIVPDPAAPRLGQVVALDGSPNVFLLGARPGDAVPPYLTLRLYPEFPPLASAIDRGEPIMLSGRPHEHPEGSGLWDLEDLGGDARPTIASRAQLESVSQVLADYGLILPNLASATAQLQGVLGELADTQADIEQSAAQASAAAGLISWTGGDHLTLPTPAGDYRIMRGTEAGQVWTRATNGAAAVRNQVLEGVTPAAVQTNITTRLIADTVNAVGNSRGRSAGDARVFRGRTYWWDETSTATADSITVMPAVGGGAGRWVMADREWGYNVRWFGAVGDGVTDDRAAIQAAMDAVGPKGHLYVPAASGYLITEALYRETAITIHADGAGSRIIMADASWGKPHFLIKSAPDVIFTGNWRLEYNGPRTLIQTTTKRTSADPRLHVIYQSTDPASNRTLASGIYFYRQCDRTRIGNLTVYGQVNGVIHATLPSDYSIYSEDFQVESLTGDTVDWAYISGGFKSAKFGRLTGRNITSTQADPTHVIYVGPRTAYNGSLHISVLELDGAFAIANNDDALRAADAFSIRCCQLCTIDSIMVRNAQMLGNFQEGRFIIGKINAVLDPLLSGAGVNTEVSVMAAQSNADVTIQEMLLETGIGWAAGLKDAFALSVSSNSSLRVRNGRVRMTHPSPGRVARMGSGTRLDLENLEMIYDSPFDAAYDKPAAIYTLSTTGKVRIKNPALTGTDRLFYATAAVDWRIHLDPTRIVSNTINTIFDAGNAYSVIFTNQHNAPPVEAAVGGTYAITLRSRNSVTVANTANAFIAGFNAGVTGQTYMLFCNDAFTALTNNASFKLLGNANIAKGTWKWIQFQMVGGVAYEIAHGSNAPVAVTVPLDFLSIPAGTAASLPATVTGAVVGDRVDYTAPDLPDGVFVQSVKVTAADTLTVRLYNASAAAIDPPSGSWVFKVVR